MRWTPIARPILKINGHFLNQPVQIFGRRKLVVSSINADRFERLRILNEAIPFEPGLRKFPPVTVALFVVNLAHPAFVFPRACSDEDVAGGETLNRCLQLEFEAGRLHGIEQTAHRLSSVAAVGDGGVAFSSILRYASKPVPNGTSRPVMIQARASLSLSTNPSAAAWVSTFAG